MNGPTKVPPELHLHLPQLHAGTDSAEALSSLQAAYGILWRDSRKTFTSAKPQLTAATVWNEVSPFPSHGAEVAPLRPD